MNKPHCDFCNAVLGHLPPFYDGDCSWNVLDTSKTHWDYCQKHEKRVEEELWKLKQRLIEEFSKQEGDDVE